LSSVPLKLGVTVLGRGGVLGIEDKKVSRTQAEIFVGYSDNEQVLITLIPKGVNKMSLTKKGSSTEDLQVDKEYILNDRDVFTLTGDRYPFEVSVLKNEGGDSQQTIDASTSELKETKTSSEVVPKKKRHIIADESDEDKSDILKEFDTAEKSPKKEEKMEISNGNYDEDEFIEEERKRKEKQAKEDEAFAKSLIEEEEKAKEKAKEKSKEKEKEKEKEKNKTKEKEKEKSKSTGTPKKRRHNEDEDEDDWGSLKKI